MGIEQYERAFETPKETTARNLAARAAVKPVAPFPKSRVCELCDMEKPFLMAIKKLHGPGGLFGCSGCVMELLGKE
jgi:hypothetical protein